MEGEDARRPNGAHTGAQPPNAAWLSGRATRFLNRVRRFDSCRGTLQQIDLEAGLALLTA